MENWINACCSHIPHTGGCTDDCRLSNPGGPTGGYEVYPTFEDFPESFELDTGNKVWIFKNGSLSSDEFDYSSDEYQFMEELPDYGFINNSNIEYMSIKIDNNTYAVISHFNS